MKPDTPSRASHASSYALAYSRIPHGIDTIAVTIETHISPGLPQFKIVGLPETTIKESKERVRCAIINSGFEFPTKRITVNLGPANLRKEGSAFDLPIALSILSASKQLPVNLLGDCELAGELSLSGQLRPIQGALLLAMGARAAQKSLFIPEDNLKEAQFAKGLCLFGAQHLAQVFNHLTGIHKQTVAPTQSLMEWISQQPHHGTNVDLSDVINQPFAKRALEIAASGRHSLLMSGPPGSGKSMLAERLTSIMPAPSEAEMLNMALIFSQGQEALPDISTLLERPFRSPHHTASSAALVGGGNPPKPGEISYAHHGILFLDELPEFKRPVLETLREPLETGKITISRAGHQVTFPAIFQLIAAMNPCPCGYLGDPTKDCQCTPKQIHLYQSRLSGPFLDRIDLCIAVKNQPTAYPTHTIPNETSSAVRSRVQAAWSRQHERQHGKNNADLGPSEIKIHCALDQESQDLFAQAIEQFGLSFRSQHRTLKVARTIADLDKSPDILLKHLQESLIYKKHTEKAKT